MSIHSRFRISPLKLAGIGAIAVTALAGAPPRSPRHQGLLG